MSRLPVRQVETKILAEEVRRPMGGMMTNRIHTKGAYNLYGIALILVLSVLIAAVGLLHPSITEAQSYTITSCGDCHNNPPVDGTARNNPEGAVVGSHNKHATTYSYACTVCHVNNTTYNHRNGNIEMISPLNNHSGTYSKGISFSQSNNPTLGNCSNTYCHSTGTGGTSQTGDARPVAANTSPTWGNNGTIACNSCHGSEAGNDGTGRPHYTSGTPKANSHETSSKHASLTCDKCHNQTTTTGNTITTYANHANRVYNVNGTGTDPYTLTYTYDANGGTCSTAYCHSNVQTVPPGGALTYQTPAWGNAASGACGTCHGSDTDPTKMATATHTKHVSTTGYNFVCSTCHSGAGSGTTKHADYSVDVAINATIGGGTYSGTPQPGDAYGSCSSIYCHSQGQSNTAPFPPTGNLAATWNTTFTESCRACHNAAVSVTPADSTDIMATNKHGSHINNASAIGKTVGCAECHKATASSDTAISGFANHVNKLVNVKFDNVINLDTDSPTYNGASTTGAAGATKNPGTAVGSCANVYCHSSGNLGAGSNLTFRTIAWNGAAIGCDGCHGDQAGKAHPVYANGGAGNVNANSHPAHVEGGKTCDICHVETTQDTAVYPALPTTVRTDLTPSRHINRTENVTFNTTKAGASAAWTAGTKTCSNLACHGSAQWGGPPMDCISCHSAALGDRRQVTGAGGDFVRQSRHVSNGTTTQIVTKYDCIVCHMEGDTTTYRTSTLHTGTPSSGADVNLRNVDLYTTGWIWNRHAINDLANRPYTLTAAQKSAMRNDMDRFCLTCHDSDTSANPATIHDIGTSYTGLLLKKVASGGGAASIKANTNGLLVGTANVGTNRFKPFNQNDNGLNAFENSTTIRRQRTTMFNNNQYPIDVRGQFNYLGAVGTNWASHHNLNIFRKRYSTRSSTAWPAAAWTTYVTKEGTNIQIAGETAGLHCSDCHLNEVNAHGSLNSAFMLSDWAGNDALATGTTSTTMTEICVKCHNRGSYGEGNTSTASRTSAHNSNNSRCNRIAPGDRLVYIGYNSQKTNTVQLSCLQCHMGDTFGGIHGTNGTYKVGNSNTWISKKYRFMGSGAAMRYYSPNRSTNGNDASWQGTSQVGCYTINAVDTWSNCNEHTSFTNPSTTNRARPLNY